jgi:fumarylacetoacetase
MNPLGPLNGKSFGTTISPWVVTPEALAPYKAPGPKRTPKEHSVSYLRNEQDVETYRLELSAEYLPSQLNGSNDLGDSGEIDGILICKTQFTSLYWTLLDLVAHQTSNGCNLNIGDLLATGTISGPTAESRGCLMESPAGVEYGINNDGPRPKLYFLKDGDTITMIGQAGQGTGFGDCFGTIQSAMDCHSLEGEGR